MKICAAAVILLCAPMWAQAPGAGADQKPVERSTTQATAQAPNATKIDPVKEADIRKLMEVSGAKQAMEKSLAESQKSIRPVLENSLPPGDYREKLIDLFFERFTSKLDVNAMLEEAVVVYDKYLSDEDIKGLTQFYQTPLGQKALSVLPQILNDTIAFGSKLGEQAGRESMEEVLAEHPELKDAMKAAAAKAQQSAPPPQPQ